VNPYESPVTVELPKLAEEHCRPAIGTALLLIWLVEGAVKTLVGAMIAWEGIGAALKLASYYSTSSRLAFFLLSWFVIVETAGPWIGVYYLTGRRSRTIAFDRAIVQILKLACGGAVVVTLVLMICLEAAAALAS
jgi:hypothetical protein